MFRGRCGRHAGIYQILQGGHGFIFRVWPSLVPAAFPGRGHPVQGAFDDQTAFEVGDRAENVEHQFAGGRGGVDPLFKADQVYSQLLQILDGLEEFLQ